MKKIIILLLSMTVTLSMMPLSILSNSYATEITSSDNELYYGEPGEDYEEGEVIVCVRGGRKQLESSGLFSRNIKVEETMMEFEATEGSVDEAAAVSKKDEEAYAEAIQVQEKETKADEEKYSFVLVKSKKDDVTELIQKLEELDCVAFAEPNIKCEPTSFKTPLTYSDVSSEPGLNYQWYMDGEKTHGDYDLNVKSAYSNSKITDQEEVVIAVMDSGVDYTHPDLVDSMWDEGENYTALTDLGGGKYGINTSSIDDVDLLSWLAGHVPETDDPMDYFVGHGTHCASTIASTWKNGKGIAGINANAKIMACCWLGSTGGGIYSWVEAMNYVITAKQAGVNVVATSNSWGVSGETAYSCGIVNIIAKQAGELGIVNCFAAGNDEYDHDAYPNFTYSSPYIVTVGAMQSNGQPAYFSERGARTVDVFAPGTQILAATSLQENVTSMPPEYLPWLQASDDSYIYENFEDNQDIIGIDAKKESGDGLSPAIADGAGLGDTKSKKIDLSENKKGDVISLEIEISSSAIKQIQNDCYIAFEVGARNIEFCSASTKYAGNKLVLIGEYYDGNKWIVPTYTTYDDYGKESIPQPSIATTCSDLNYSVLSTYMTEEELEPMIEAASRLGKLKLRFTIEIDSISSGAEIYIDNFGIGKTTSDYFYSDGTSMACPCVSAVASIIAGTYSAGTKTADDTLKIIARLKGGVKKTGGLDNQCLTQGCVQADSAFMTEDELNPVPNVVIASSDGTATIEGDFFGGTNGSVKIDGTQVQIKNWENQKIEVTVPQDTPLNSIQYEITKSNGNTGRGFGIFKTNLSDDAVAYKDLKVSENIYEIGGQQVAATELIPMCMAANDDGILAFLIDTTDSFATFEFYSYDTKEWTEVETDSKFEDREIDIDSSNCDKYSMAGTKSKFYFLCMEGITGPSYLFTYNSKTKEWEKVVKAGKVLYGSLGIIDDELYCTMTGMDVAPINWKLLIKKLDPDIGEGNNKIDDTVICNTQITEYVQFYGGNILTSGTTKVFAGARQGALGTRQPPIAYKNGNWELSKVDFYRLIDAKQNMNIAYAPTNQGFIVIGPTKDTGKSSMTDSWSYDISSDSYTEIPILADGAKLSSPVATCHDGKLYLLARSNIAGNKLIFRNLELSKVGLSYSKPTNKEQLEESGNASISGDGEKIPETPPISGGGGNAGAGEEENEPVELPNLEKIEILDLVTYTPSISDMKLNIIGLEGLKEGVDYELKLSQGANKIGKHTVDIKFKGKYSSLDTKTLEYKCVPQGTVIKKSNPGKKSLKVLFAKQNVQTTGYQIRYSLKSNMKSSKIETVPKNTTTSKTIKNLKSKKNYYVQVRTYKNVMEGKKTVKYCSSWSNKKSVKVK